MSSERIAILESLLKGGIAPDVLLPGTGASNIPDTIELTRHALSVGVTSVLTYTPGNPPGWEVEAGNVGSHYHQWRYGG